jgi:hypothetical protein
LRSSNTATITGNISGGNISIGGQADVSGTITGGNLTTGGNVTATGNVSGANLISSGSISATTTASVTGNATVGNLTTAGRVTATGNVSAGNLLTSGVTIASTSITASGILTLNSGNAVTAIVNGAGNAIGNIGSTSKYFNTVFAQASSALYADLAECYLADAEYAPGTVLSFGGAEEVTISTQEHDTAVAGVVSTNPAYQMNSGLQGEHVAKVALVGRVPCQVQGPIVKGSLMVSAGNGRAKAAVRPDIGTVIGKAVENFEGETGVIEIVVGRL